MRLRLIAACAVTALALAGCSGGGKKDSAAPSTPTPTTVAAKSTSLDSVKVSGQFKKKPKITVDAPLDIAKSSHKTLIKGKGGKVAKGQQLTVQMTAVAGQSGKTFDSTFAQKKPAGFPMDTKQINPDLYDALLGQSVGSRVLLNIKGSAGDDSQPQTIVYVIDIVKAAKAPQMLKRATGSKVPAKKGLPTVSLAKNGKPSISKPTGKKPDKLVVQPTIKGKGATVKKGQKTTFQYSGWLWDDNTKPFDSSWNKGQPLSTPIGTGQLIKGWDKGIVGQKVGSQLLLVVPPKLGYGSSGNGSIPGNSTLVFVIDILGAVG